jgi:16S rRNA (cytidine1402-2'-O)-methyltransferase
LLYIVSTPIGNLSDITLRALETLKEVDLIISEDTRKTGVLLKHFDIHKPQLSFHIYNEQKEVPKIIKQLEEGLNIALVSNAGTPVISDPGFSIVRAAIEHEIPLTCIPGPTAVTTALVLSGLPAHAFIFRGFPPRKSSARRRFMEVDKESPHTLIFYESPYRLVSFLEDALVVFGDRPAAITNDMTKKFETIYRGTLAELINKMGSEKILGEYCVMIGGRQD